MTNKINNPLCENAEAGASVPDATGHAKKLNKWSEAQIIVSLAYAGFEFIESAAGRANDKANFAELAYHAADILRVIKQRGDALVSALDVCNE
jgi:hypothetical protein